MADLTRDWTEDSAHENGNYQNRCCLCYRLFIGHKRRVVCRACHDGGRDAGDLVGEVERLRRRERDELRAEVERLRAAASPLVAQARVADQLTEAMRRLCEAADAVDCLSHYSYAPERERGDFKRALQAYRDAKAEAQPAPKLCGWCGGEIEDSEACVNWTWQDEACVAHVECYLASRKLRPGEEWTPGDFARGCLCQNGACECQPAAEAQPAPPTSAGYLTVADLAGDIKRLSERATTCPNCMGVGRVMAEAQPAPDDARCKECDGTGEVTMVEWPSVVRKEPCPRCSEAQPAPSGEEGDDGC